MVHNQKANDREEEAKQSSGNTLAPHPYSNYKVFPSMNIERNVIISSSFLHNEINQHIQSFYRKRILESQTLKH